MKMHEHNEEIIMAIAEGALDDVAATAAHAEIAGCAECTRDLELQRLALSALEEAPSVYLTAAESSRLHQGLKRELTGIKLSPAPRKPRVAWGKWLPALAGTAAVFLVVFMILPGVMGGGDSDSSDVTTASATETTAAAATEQSALERTTTAAAAPVAPEEAANLGDDTALDYMAGAEAATEAPAASTTTSAATETTASEDPTWVDVLPIIGFGDLSEEVRQNIIDQLRTDDSRLRLLDESTKATTTRIETCFSQLAIALGIPEGSEAIAVGNLAGTDGAERLVVAYVPDDVNETVLVATSYPVCEAFQVIP